MQKQPGSYHSLGQLHKGSFLLDLLFLEVTTSFGQTGAVNPPHPPPQKKKKRHVLLNPRSNHIFVYQVSPGLSCFIRNIHGPLSHCQSHGVWLGLVSSLVVDMPSILEQRGVSAMSFQTILCSTCAHLDDFRHVVTKLSTLNLFDRNKVGVSNNQTIKL